MVLQHTPCLIPQEQPRCPLGLVCENQDSYWYQDKTTWHSCINREYCCEIVSPWHLPLSLGYEEDFFSVCLIPPSNFTRASYQKYMRGYGWAEPHPIRLSRGLGKFQEQELRVVSNCFEIGFGIAVPVRGELGSIGFHKQDKKGIWWATWGKTPKDSEKRWKRLAQK